jgi:hypothetical protein
MSIGIADTYTSSVRDDDAAVPLIHRALDLGMTPLDTADILARLAKDLYSHAGLPPVTVFIGWTESPRLSMSRRRAGVRLLCDTVVQNRPAGDEFSRDVGDGDALVHPDLPIRALSISWASSPEGSDCRDWNFHDVQPYPPMAGCRR